MKSPGVKNRRRIVNTHMTMLTSEELVGIQTRFNTKTMYIVHMYCLKTVRTIHRPARPFNYLEA